MTLSGAVLWKLVHITSSRCGGCTSPGRNQEEEELSIRPRLLNWIQRISVGLEIISSSSSVLSYV
jgi:hypothetical protein